MSYSFAMLSMLAQQAIHDDPSTAAGGLAAAAAVPKAQTIEQVVIPPAALTTDNGAEVVWFGAQRTALMRFQLHRPMVVGRAAIDCGVASGNIEVAVYSVTRTSALGQAHSLVKLATSGVVACPTPGSNGAQGSQIIVPFASAVTLQPGEYALALWCDNVTATFTQRLSNVATRTGWSFSDGGGASASGAPAALSAASYGGRSFAGLLESAMPVRPTAVLLGDSITQNQTWFDLANAADSAPWALGYNAGIAGQQTGAILARVQADVIARNPALVTILGGTNDLGATQTPDPAPVIANLGAMVSRILAGTTARIILGTVTPRNFDAAQTPLSSQSRAAFAAVNTWIRAQAGVRVQIADWSVQLSTGDGLTPNLTYFSDQVHPNPAGAAVMANVLAPLLL